MALYQEHVLPLLLDLSCRAAPVRHQREQTVPRARGRVLELGIGTGLNLAYYDIAKLEALWGLDPAGALRPRAERRARAKGIDVQLVQARGEEIPLADTTVDTVVMTYTLCSVADPGAVLAEVRRVLMPAGQLLFCEHGRAPDARVQRWQDRLTPIWGRIAGGCHLNRPVRDLMQYAGFQLRELQMDYLPRTPRPVGYHYRGCATPA